MEGGEAGLLSEGSDFGEMSRVFLSRWRFADW